MTNEQPKFVRQIHTLPWAEESRIHTGGMLKAFYENRFLHADVDSDIYSLWNRPSYACMKNERMRPTTEEVFGLRRLTTRNIARAIGDNVRHGFKSLRDLQPRTALTAALLAIAFLLAAQYVSAQSASISKSHMEIKNHLNEALRKLQHFG